MKTETHSLGLFSLKTMLFNRNITHVVKNFLVVPSKVAKRNFVSEISILYSI